MSWATRNVFNTINLLRTTKYSHQILCLLSNKEVGLVKNVINQDILLQSLKAASSSNNLLDLVNTHNKIMNSKHVMQSFRSLFNLEKSKNQQRSSKELISNYDFKTLCRSLRSQIRFIEINDQIEALKILSYIGVQSNSTIMQIILQMIRQNCNNLNLQHIIFLDFLLKQFESTPLSDALLIALPIIFEIQLPRQIDVENTSSLTDLLQFASKNRLSEKTIDYILEIISTKKDINIKQALSIIWSLCDLKPRDDFSKILTKCLKICRSGFDLSINDLETTLTKLAFRYNSKYLFYYDKDFFDLVANQVVENDLGFQQAVWILNKFSKIGHTHNGLLDYISNLCYSNPNLVRRADSWNLFNLVTGFASTDYKPVHWESLKQNILEHTNIFDNKRELNWTKFAIRLAILDLFIPDVLQKTFSQNYVEKILHDGVYANLENFLILYQTISCLYPEYNNLLPNQSYIDQAIKQINLSSLEHQFRPLQSALECGFGGKEYIRTNVATKLGHLLHHIVVMRKGGHPIAFNTNEDKLFFNIDDLQLPTDCHIIAVFGCDASFYKLNTKILRSIYSLMFRTIEANGCSVVAVPVEAWIRMPDHEKIPYLMHLIRMKNQDYETMSIEQ